MLKVVLFLVLFNSSTGQVVQTRAAGFETVQQCEQVLQEARASKPAEGFAVDGVCLIPSDNTRGI